MTEQSPKNNFKKCRDEVWSARRNLPLEPDSDQCLIYWIRRLVEIRSEHFAMLKPAWSVGETQCENMQEK